MATGTLIGLGIILVGCVWRMGEDDRIKRDQDREIRILKKKVKDLEGGKRGIEKAADILNDKLDRLAHKIDDKF